MMTWSSTWIGDQSVVRSGAPERLVKSNILRFISWRFVGWSSQVTAVGPQVCVICNIISSFFSDSNPSRTIEVSGFCEQTQNKLMFPRKVHSAHAVKQIDGFCSWNLLFELALLEEFSVPRVNYISISGASRRLSGDVSVTSLTLKRSDRLYFIRDDENVLNEMK